MERLEERHGETRGRMFVGGEEVDYSAVNVTTVTYPALAITPLRDVRPGTADVTVEGDTYGD